MSSNTVFKYTGTIIFIGETEQVSDNFKKRVFILSDKEREYPQEIAFEMHQGKCDELDKFVVGSLVEIDFNLRGRHWKDNKWFNTLQAWRITNKQVSTYQNVQPANQPSTFDSYITNNPQQEFDDMPF